MEEKEPAGNGQSVMRYSTGGVFDDIERLAGAIKKMGEQHNLIIPGGAIGTKMLPLYAAGISFVFPDLARETYPVGDKDGKVGLAKTVLDRIAAGAGVRWNPHFCGRVDNGSNPYIVEYQAVGTVLQLDGAERPLQATKRIDLRAEKDAPRDTWGPDAQEIARIAEKKGREPWPQILQQRQHILSLAETKAKNRAIRTLGVRTNYDVKELEKGFAVVKLQFTGQSSDPEIAREVAIMIAERALGGSAKLYGGERELGPIPRVQKIVGQEGEEETEEKKPENGKAAPAAAPEASAAKPETAKANTPPPAEKAKTSERVKPADDPLLICGDKDPVTKKWPRKPCSEFEAEVLKAKIFAAEKNRPKWEPQWVDKNEKELLAMKAWLAYKEFDPSQGVLPGVDRTSDTVPF